MAWWDSLVKSADKVVKAKQPATRAVTPKAEPARPTSPAPATTGSTGVDTLLKLLDIDPTPKAAPAAEAKPEKPKGTALASWKIPEAPDAEAQYNDRIKSLKKVADQGSDSSPYARAELKDLERGKDKFIADIMKPYDERMKRMQTLGIVSDDLGMATGALTTVDLPKGKPLSQSAYDALNPNARAAIDYNTLLSEAVNKDTRLTAKGKYAKVDQKKRDEYEKLEKEIFGEDRGSDLDVYAPETLAVLRQLNIKEDTAADFDDYLGLKVVLKPDDVKNINGGALGYEKGLAGQLGNLAETMGADVPGGDRDRLVYAQQAANRAKTALEAAMTEGRKFLQDYRTTLQLDRSQLVADLGGINKKASSLMLGYNDGGQYDEGFQRGYDSLLTSNRKQIADQMSQLEAAAGPEMRDAFLDYVSRRTSSETAYGLPTPNAGDGVERHSATELRKLLKLDRGGKR